MRTVDAITDDLVAATRHLHTVRVERERAVACLADREGVLERARQRVTALRDEWLRVVDTRAGVRSWPISGAGA